jgi:ATP-binding protein involved in chromosome partitioning
VTTPQDIARIDTAKALAMFQQAEVPVLGVVQNMDGYVCPHCGERSNIFPQSQEVRAQLDSAKPLGSVPLDPAAVVSGDRGQPVVVSMPEAPVAIAFAGIAEQVEVQIAVLRAQQDDVSPSRKMEGGTEREEEAP